MAGQYTKDALQRTFDYLLGDQVRVSTFATALTERVLSGPIEPTGIEPYRLLAQGTHDQLVAAGIATKGPEMQDEWARLEIRDNAPTGLFHTLNMLQVVERLYADHATVPQRADTVARSLDATTRHMAGFARLGGRTILNSSLAQSQGISPRSPDAPQARHNALVSGTAMAAVTTQTYAVHDPGDGQLLIRPQFRHVRAHPQERHCPAVDTLVASETSQIPALYTLLRTIGSVAATTIYPRSFTIV